MLSLQDILVENWKTDVKSLQLLLEADWKMQIITVNFKPFNTKVTSNKQNEILKMGFHIRLVLTTWVFFALDHLIISHEEGVELKAFQLKLWRPRRDKNSTNP